MEMLSIAYAKNQKMCANTKMFEKITNDEGDQIQKVNLPQSP